MRAPALGLLLALSCALAPAGCAARPQPRTHHVEIRQMRFVPAQLDVAVGDTVVWTNHDVMPHTATTAPSSSERFDSRSIEGRGTWSFTVATAGEHPYVCTFHPTMQGRLTAR
ncbi:MAG: plastocyanin/azurin family copper-binding protein [Kofleriaceae bacterium]